jgi:hypothetical protein
MAAVITDPQSSARNVIQPTGDFINLTLRAFPGQTAPLLQFETSAGVVVGQVDSIGRAQFGFTSILPLQGLSFFYDFSSQTSGSLFGIRGTLQTVTAADSSANLTGSAPTASFQGTFKSTGTITGLLANGTHQSTDTAVMVVGVTGNANKNSTGVVATALGGSFQVNNNNATGVITTGTGVRVSSPTKTGGFGTARGVHVQNQGGAGVTTAVGLLIDAQSGAGTNIALQVGAGNEGFFGATPVAQQTGASAAGIAAITDANAKAAVQALQTALANLGFVTSPA